MFRARIHSRVFGSFGHLGRPTLICFCALRVAQEGASQMVKLLHTAALEGKQPDK